MGLSIQPALAKALALYRRGEAAEAEAHCRAIVHLDPEQADAWQLLGLIALDRGDDEAAVAALRKAVGLDPDFAPYRVNLANAYQAAGGAAEAEATLRTALTLQGDLPDAHYNLGNLLRSSGRTDEAERCFEQAIVLKPDHAEALNNLGQLGLQGGEAAAAERYFRRALAAAPGNGMALSGLCGALSELGRTGEAIDSGRLAVAASPDSAAAHYNLGNAYMAAALPAEAEACYRRALRCDPGFADAEANLGSALQAGGRHDAAIAAFDAAIARSPDAPDAHWNKAIALLSGGRYAEGWALYEWRWRAVAGLDLPQLVEPLWDGGALDGRTILVICEQGFGDALQFVRYLPMVRARGGRVVLECPPMLEPLLSAQQDGYEVVAQGDPRPAFDCWLPMMSLPRVFGTELGSIPARCPYLAAPAALSYPTAAGNGFSVGLVWRGSLTNNRGRFRSCRLADFEPLLAVEGVTCYSLQTELSAEDRRTAASLPLVDLGSGFANFADSAAAVAHLDLVISVDTATAHLAGALGRPVWTILSATPDWRWLTDRDDSPWYPTMRLFRQRTAAGWAGTVSDVAAALAAHGCQIEICGPTSAAAETRN